MEIGIGVAVVWIYYSYVLDVVKAFFVWNIYIYIYISICIYVCIERLDSSIRSLELEPICSSAGND